MKLLHTDNVQGNIHETATWLNSKGWADKVVSISSTGFTTTVVVLIDSEELLKIRSQPRFDFSEHKRGMKFDFPDVVTIEHDYPQWSKAEQACVDYYTNYECPKAHVLTKMWQIGRQLCQERG